MSIADQILKESMGIIQSEEQLDQLIAESRFHPCLVRCGNGRFTCPAQDVRHFTDIINASKDDYVRNISVMRTNLYTRFTNM